MITLGSSTLAGLMKFLAKGTTDRIIEGQDDKLESLLRTFRHNLQNKYNRYTFFFFLCEVLNFLIMAFQFYVTGGRRQMLLLSESGIQI